VGGGGSGYWWTAMEYGSGSAYRRSIYYSSDYDVVDESGHVKDYGYSVRCVRD